MLPSFFLVLGILVLSLGLRSFRKRTLHRLGSLGILVTSFLAGWLLAHSLTLGIVLTLSWFLFPWLEILTRIRSLRLPIARTLTPCTPPTRNVFPHFESLTQEIEAADFVYVADIGWEWKEYHQFYRVFYHPQKRTQATICLIQQFGLAFYYISLRSNDKNGVTFMTWNYPFSYGLKLSPKYRLHTALAETTFSELEKRHENFLVTEGAHLTSLLIQSEEEMQKDIELDTQSQIIHNIDLGLLKREGKDFFKYSLRGMIFLWLQVVRDMVRFS